MNPRARPWVVAAALLALAVFAFFQLFEQRRFEFETGFRDEAARNRYLAAQRLLERMGMQVRSLSLGELRGLPPVDGALVLPTERATLSLDRSRELLDWVRAGGHLLVVTWTLWDEEDRREDPLLDPLGFRQFGRLGEAEEIVQDEIARVRVPGRDPPLEVEHDPRFRFVDSEGRATWSVEDANGVHLLQTRLGAGYLTALTDDFFLTNTAIAEHDHAELVYRLARTGGRAGPVWIVFAEEWPRPWQLLSAGAWVPVLAFAILVAAWGWMRAARFGPIRPDPPRDRRSLMEHVWASGRFHWQHGDAGMLVECAREALMERVRTRHPGWRELRPAELHARLAELSDVPRERIDRALAHRPEIQPERFSENIATMERITRAI